ncbi:MAG TPA: DUF47 family protein [Candidatus Scatomorpha merdigallinarum]|nr:DUF47 family protein [Candidatus Scatomorpha merdigallinarum]
MSKKQDEYFFNNFIECADYACKAAHLLEEVMDNFDPEALPGRLDEMHELEHSADESKHAMIDVLVKAFITPIEREDIIDLSHCIDNMTDKIEDVFIRLYTNNVREMRPDAVEMAKVVVRCCESVKEMLVEFPNFKRSKTLKDHIIRINTMEEEADRRFISCMANLHRSGADVLDIIAWREIYKYIENCADACENVADVVEGVIMDNT